MKTKKRDELMEIARTAARLSGGRLRLAYQEDNTSLRTVPDAAHFLKLGGERVGRDIEMYGFFGDGPVGWPETLVMFLQEVLLPLKAANLLKAYEEAANKLQAMGEDVYPPERLGDWRELF